MYLQTLLSESMCQLYSYVPSELLCHGYVLFRDVKRTSNLRTSKFIFEFGILTFDIRVKFALEQMWALKCLQMRRDVFVLCRRLTPAASPADCRGLRRRCWCLITSPVPAPYL